MAGLSPEELRRLQLEEAQRIEEQKAAEAASASASPEQPVGGAEAPQVEQAQQSAELAQQTEARQQAKTETQKVEREEGLITQLGRGLEYLTSSDLTTDGLNALAAGANILSGGRLQGLDDAVLGSEEMKEREIEIAEGLQQRREDGEMSGLEQVAHTTANALEGVAEGARGGLALPATIGARIAGQATPWADPPETLRNSPVGETIFEITQVLVPTVLTGGVVSAAGGSVGAGAALLGESAAETATQDSFDDLIAGRQLAGGLGALADHLGYDGAQFTADLIEGRTPSAQVLTAVIGLIQNTGINFGADKLFGALGRAFPQRAAADAADSQLDEAAGVLGIDGDELRTRLGNKNEPTYSADYEPHDSIDIDSANNVVKPANEGSVISDEALIVEARRAAGIGEDGLLDAQREYFTNWKAVVDEDSLAKSLQQATETLKKLKDFPEDMKNVTNRAALVWDDVKRALDRDMDEAANIFKRESTSTFKPVREGLDDATILREYSMVDADGFIVGGLIAEELGIRLKHMAKQADNLDSINVDFSTTVENLIELHEKASLFMTPLRRAKRRWAVEGMSQQRKTIKGLKDADIQDARRAQIKNEATLSSDAAGRDYEVVHSSQGDEGSTLRELWTKYQQGDQAAGDTLKAYVKTVAYGDARFVLGNAMDLSRTMRDQLKLGNTDAVTQLYYNGMLSRIQTQVSAGSSNIARMVAEPIGMMLSGIPKAVRGDYADISYGFGQFIGGMGVARDALAAARRSFKENRNLVGAGSRIDAEQVGSLALKQAQLDQTYEGVLRELTESNAGPSERFGAWMQYTAQTLANNPILGAGPRFLMAQDAFSNVIVGGQIATGRAWREAVQNNNFKDLDRLIEHHTSRVFRDGVTGGKIVDQEVLDVARNITFTEDIGAVGKDLEITGIGRVGAAIDSAFTAVKEGADQSAIFRFASPFTRVSWGILESVARYEPTGALRTLHPRYKAIMDGKMGETARLQLKSQIAFGQFWALSGVGLAVTGMATGNNSGDMPRNSFIIPAQNDVGYVAVPYEKLEPFGTILSIVVDSVNAVKNGVLGEKEYDRQMQELFVAIGMATLDKSFMQGLSDTAGMFEALTGGGMKSLPTVGADLISSAVPMSGFVRMVSDWVNPYKTISTEANPISSLFSQLRSRAFGGAGNPLDYDELTGKPIRKSASAFGGGDDGYWAAVASEIFQEIGWPGRVKDADKDNPIKVKLRELGYDPKGRDDYAQVHGVELTIQEQSELKRLMHEEGKLSERLDNYFKSKEYKKLRRALDKSIAEAGLEGTSQGTVGSAQREAIHAAINTIWNRAKEDAARALASDPNSDFKDRIRDARNGGLPPTRNPVPMPHEQLANMPN